MKIAHVGAWNRNFGDWVLKRGIEQGIQLECPGISLEWANIDCQKTLFTPEVIKQVNECDLLIVGGGGLIFHRPMDESVSGWQWNISLEGLSKLTVPLVVYGIGYNKFPYDSEDFNPGTFEHLRAVQEKAALFSVRNSGTERELVRRGLDPTKIAVVMDAGAFYVDDAFHVEPMWEITYELDDFIIGLNIAGDRPEHRYPKLAVINEVNCLVSLAKALRCEVDKRNAKVLFIPHISKENVQNPGWHDEMSYPVFESILGEPNIVNLADACPDIYPPSYETVPAFLAAYGLCDLVVGMRGHANLIAYGLGIPFIPFGEHRKNLFLLEDVGRSGEYISTEHMIATGEQPNFARYKFHYRTLACDRWASYELFRRWNRQVVTVAKFPTRGEV